MQNPNKRYLYSLINDDVRYINYFLRREKKRKEKKGKREKNS